MRIPHFMEKVSLPSLRPNSAVGIDVGSSSIKAVEIASKGRGRGFDLKSFGSAVLPVEAIVQGAFLNPSAIVDGIREAVEDGRVESRNAVVAVSGHSVIVKKVLVPLQTQAELEEAIHWEAEQYIPFDINEVHLDFQILDHRGDDGQMEVLLVAAKKDLVADYLQIIHEAGLTLSCVDVAAFAVENAFEANYDHSEGENVALVNVGAEVININVMHDGIPAFARDIAMGGNRYTEEIQKALSIDFEQAERLKVGGEFPESAPDAGGEDVDAAVLGVTESIIDEIGRSLDFYAATSTDGGISRVMLSGGAIRTGRFETMFREQTGLEVERLNPLARMCSSGGVDPARLEELAPSLGVGVGLGLRTVGLS